MERANIVANFISRYIDEKLIVKSNNYLLDLQQFERDGEIKHRIIPFNQVPENINFPFIAIDYAGNHGVIFKIKEGKAYLKLFNNVYYKKSLTELSNVEYALFVLDSNYQIKKRGLIFDYLKFYFWIAIFSIFLILLSFSISYLLIPFAILSFGRQIYVHKSKISQSPCGSNPFTECDKTIGKSTKWLFFSLLMSYLLFVCIGSILNFSGIIWFAFVYFSTNIALLLFIHNVFSNLKCTFCLTTNLVVLLVNFEILHSSSFNFISSAFEFTVFIACFCFSIVSLSLFLFFFNPTNSTKRQNQIMERFNKLRVDKYFAEFQEFVLNYNAKDIISNNKNWIFIFVDPYCESCVEKSLDYYRTNIKQGNDIIFVPAFYDNSERGRVKMESFGKQIRAEILKNYSNDFDKLSGLEYHKFQKLINEVLDSLQLTSFPCVVSTDKAEFLI